MKKILVLAALAICLLACEVQASGRRAVIVRGRQRVIVQRPFVQRQFFRQRAFFGGYGGRFLSGHGGFYAAQGFYGEPFVADFSGQGYGCGGFSQGFRGSAIIIRRR